MISSSGTRLVRLAISLFFLQFAGGCGQLCSLINSQNITVRADFFQDTEVTSINLVWTAVTLRMAIKTPIKLPQVPLFCPGDAMLCTNTHKYHRNENKVQFCRKSTNSSISESFWKTSPHSTQERYWKYNAPPCEGTIPN